VIAHLAASTLVALVAVAASLALHGKSGAWRHALLLAAVLRFAAPTPWLAAAGAKLAPYAHPRSARQASIDRLADLLLFGDARLGLPAAPAEPGSKGIFHPYLLVWAAGFGLCLTLWLRGLFGRIPSVREASPEELEALGRARCAFGSGAAAELRIAGPEQAPGVRGMWRASIVLPDGLSTQLNAAELEAVLLHELAHVRRRDNLSASMSHLVVCAFWFYPPIWWLEWRMLREREAACDEIVLAQGANAEEYLSGLVKVCRMSYSTPAGYAGAGGSNFQTRMEQIMSADFQRSSTPILRASAAAVVALAVMIPASGAFLKAQQTAQEPLTRTLTSAERQVQTGMAMLKAGNSAGAEEAFRMARELDPESADLHLALGNVAVRAQQYDLALAEFQAVLDTLDPDSAAAGDIHMRMGEAYRRMGKIDAAIAQLRLAKNLLPDRAAAVASTLALCLDKAGRWREAEDEYQAVLRIDPNNGVSLNNLAYLLSQHSGDPDLALSYAQRAAQLMPQMPEISDTLGTICLAKGMIDEALATFRRILQNSPAGAEHLALRLVENGQRDAVWADLTAALANHHSNQDDQAIAGIMQKIEQR
jgi:beta-lactamase regulating signal transducer with metallopeptidase domain/lipoprotein NlpI